MRAIILRQRELNWLSKGGLIEFIGNDFVMFVEQSLYLRKPEN